ncbi:MAG: Mur ligase family protein [Bacteroidota bacterium]
MRVHFIAIGGSAMHNLAIALHEKGYEVTGSDDEVFEPSKGRLLRYGLLPAKEGWFEESIHEGLDAVILGMHAKADNPELLRAKELSIKIFSYPEYLYEQSKLKVRVVIGGSHGKTTITAMILHVLKEAGIDCDYMVGAQLEGFDVMVRITESAKVMIIEGDEYLTSPIDRRPKFHLYKPDIALISGIGWDHINVFPTFENYLEQFRIFINLITQGGDLIYCSEDNELQKICPGARDDLKIEPYTFPRHSIENGKTSVQLGDQSYPLKIFGDHNLLNFNGARAVCQKLGIKDEIFFKAMSSFKGASKRLELLAENETCSVYKDFAHAPSKVQATIQAVKQQFPERELIACLELHTYSSLNENFLSHYKETMDLADKSIVYFNRHALQIKKLPDLEPAQIQDGFSNKNLEVFNSSTELIHRIEKEEWKNKNLLMMSSGDFDGIDLISLAKRVTRNV